MHPPDTAGAGSVLEIKTRDDSNTERGNATNGNGSGGVNARRRSRSVASAPPSVETVVVKAKRAAASIWMMLHAQNCVLGAGKCPHNGCQEAKLLHLHLKTCPAGTGFECPVHHKGCDQSRKLLAHYRRCRSIRARQAGQHPSRRDPGQQHVCLVCSLVARQAKIMLEGSGSAASSLSSSSSSSSSSRPIKPSTLRNPISSRQVVSSFTLSTAVSEEKEAIIPGAAKMPPPPPRRLNWSTTTKVADGMMGPPSSKLGMSFDSVKGSYMEQARVESERTAGRERSVSNVDTGEKPKALQRNRSVSLGSTPVDLACDTILEEELNSETKDSDVDFEFNIDLAHQAP